LPGVEAVGLADSLPLSTRLPNGSSWPFFVRGEPVQARRSTQLCQVSRDFFPTIGVRTVEGRSFTASDDAAAPRVAVVNEHMSHHYWGDQSPVGKEVTAFKDRSGKDVWFKIVGVVSDVRQVGLDKEPIDELIVPWEQGDSNVMSMAVRTTGSLETLGREVSWIAHDIDKDVAVTDVQPMTQVRTESLASPRITATFLTIFAVIALAITASGISGMMALMANDRKQEIGIRLALGATPGAVMRAMFAKVAPAMCGGLVLGLVAAWWLSKSMNDIVIGVPVRDSLTFATSSLVLAATAILFAVAPLTSISRLDPSTPLRAE
jgi:putative ABC transport system permease protein